MDMKSDFFYICLIIHCSIYYSEAASSDEDEEATKKKNRRWTPEEEEHLIFFDVLTDTGEIGHFKRIRDMWRREYPKSNVTDHSLRFKLRKLRKESLEEGEYRKYFKWNETLERELLDVYRNTRPYNEDASMTLGEEWKRRHPEYPSKMITLLVAAHRLLREKKYPEYGTPDRKPKTFHRYPWTPERKKKFRSVFELTDTGEPYHFERIKSKWSEEYPDSNVTDNALLNQIRSIRRELKKKGERRGLFRWKEESERELLDIYFDTYPYKTDVNITLEDEWNRRHPGYRTLRKSLLDRAQKLIRENKYPDYRAQESSTADLQWDDQHDSELMHLHKIAIAKGGPYLRRTQQIWSGLHPQYKHVTPEQIKERLDYLKMNSPTENFPWTEGENEELLNIYDETMSNKEDQGQRIYDIWSQKHPRYKFMTPYYLQVHASTLARKREVEAGSRYMKSRWTDKEKADLVDMIHRYPRTSQDEFHAFHEEWVRKHPRLAYKNNSHLFYAAKRFERLGIRPRSVEMGEGSRSELLNSSLHARRKYTTKQKEELRVLFNQTFPKNYGHTTRIKERWNEIHEGSDPIKNRSLKRLIKKWKDREPDKRADKAPIVYSSDESGPSSPPMMSGDFN